MVDARRPTDSLLIDNVYKYLYKPDYGDEPPLYLPFYAEVFGEKKRLERYAFMDYSRRLEIKTIAPVAFDYDHRDDSTRATVFEATETIVEVDRAGRCYYAPAILIKWVAHRNPRGSDSRVRSLRPGRLNRIMGQVLVGPELTSAPRRPNRPVSIGFYWLNDPLRDYDLVSWIGVAPFYEYVIKPVDLLNRYKRVALRRFIHQIHYKLNDKPLIFESMLDDSGQPSTVFNKPVYGGRKRYQFNLERRRRSARFAHRNHEYNSFESPALCKAMVGCVSWLNPRHNSPIDVSQPYNGQLISNSLITWILPTSVLRLKPNFEVEMV